MTAEAAFTRHDAARIFFAGKEVMAPGGSHGTGVRAIPAKPTTDALDQLAHALSQGAPFCILDAPLPDDIEAGPGEFLTLTGGTSGPPKVILRKQRSWTASFAVNAARFDLTQNDSVAVLGSLAHSLALYGVIEAMHLGMNAHVIDGMRPRGQRAVLANHRVSVLYATPTQLRLLAGGARGETLPDLRLILCGGGMLDAATRAMVDNLCPQAAMLVFYGAAETSFITIADVETPPGSVGRAYPGVSLQILDTNGQPAKGVGEVWVQSPYLFERYASGGSADTRWRDGFLSVGEMGELDADRHLWLRGRRTRMVTVADCNVFPEEIEAWIVAQGHATACAVLPMADAARGSRLAAVLEGPADVERAQHVRAACQAEFGTAVAPYRVLFHPRLPLLASGKTDLGALARWLEGQT